MRNRPAAGPPPEAPGDRDLSFYRDEALPLFEIKTCRSGLHSTRPHFHEELSLALVERGTSRVEAAGRVGTVRPGDLLLIAPGVLHSCSPVDRRRWGFSLLYLRPEFLEALRIRPASPAVPDLLWFSPGEGEIRRIRKTLRLLRSPRPAPDKERALRKLGDLLRRLRLRGEETPLLPPRPDPFPRIREARDLLEERSRESLPLEELASTSGVSPSHLTREFKRAYGLTPHQCQILLRINEARRMLRQGIPPGRAAQLSGFYDQSHFTRLFREVCGLPPKAYLERTP